jgi:hypothetical protein
LPRPQWPNSPSASVQHRSIGASAWISDDAINEGDKLDPQRFKTIVTGEAIELDRKQRDGVRVELDIPVVLTANSLPGARDSSDAVFNRCLVVDMLNVISEEAAELSKQQAGLPNDVRWFADWLFERESSGILNGALDGLERLLRRGRFEIPGPVAASIQGFKDSTMPVGEWARTTLVRSQATKIERGDLLCAFQGWWRQEMGDDVRHLGGRWLFPKFRVACPWAAEIKIRGVRFYGGVALVAEGLKLWSYQNDSASRGGRGAKGTVQSDDFVNKLWDRKLGDDENKPEVDQCGSPSLLMTTWRPRGHFGCTSWGNSLRRGHFQRGHFCTATNKCPPKCSLLMFGRIEFLLGGHLGGSSIPIYLYMRKRGNIGSK